jgi:hypothetical protein
MGVTSLGAAEPAQARFRIATPTTALALAVVALVLALAAVALSALTHKFSSGDGGAVIVIVLPGFGLVGLLLARRAPTNPIGWCMLGAAAFLAVDGVASTYSVLDFRLHGGRLPLGPLAVLAQPSWAPAIVLFALSILLFPDGKLPSGRWRVPLAVFVLSAGVWLGGAYALAMDAIVSHGVRVDSTGNLLQADHPTGSWAWWGVSQQVFFLTLAAVGIAWVVGQVPAYRRATGVRRQQLKLLLAGATVAICGGFLSIAAGTGSGLATALAALGAVGLLGVPVSIGVGITKYRLYDIDRIVSRTLSYAVLTGLLVGVFAGLVLLSTRVLPFSSPVGVAASTLAALALFNPLRGRIQRVVDRRFNRARYDAEELVAAFGTRLRDEVDVDTVLAELANVAGRSLQPAHVSVWVRP